MHFSPSARTEVIEHVANGGTLTSAAAATAVPLSTIKSWITRGRRESSGPAHEFERAVDIARQTHRVARQLAPVSPGSSDPAPMTADEFRQHLERGVRSQLGWAAKLWSDYFLDPPPAEPEPAKPVSAIARLADAAVAMPVKTPNTVNDAFAELDRDDLAARRPRPGAA